MLKVHVSYGPLDSRKLLKKFNRAGNAARAVKGLAHITGGGFIDNIPRVLPKKCDAVIRKGSWEVPPIFQLLPAKGGVAEAELYQVFNMGIGMTMIVAAGQGGRRAAIHPRPQTSRLDHRRSRPRHRRGPHPLTMEP